MRSKTIQVAKRTGSSEGPSNLNPLVFKLEWNPQGDELARLRAKMLEEAGKKTDNDDALRALQEELSGVHGLSKEQLEQVRAVQSVDMYRT